MSYNLPHFIHIGFPKTASTWLQDVFSQHREICLVYKPKFFQWDDCFSKGGEFYLNLFHSNPDHKIILDSDEAYAKGEHYGAFGWDCCYKEKHPKSWGDNTGKFILPYDRQLIANRMHQTVPNAKIMMVIRNQTDWLISAYKHKISGGRAWSFKEFLKKEFVPIAFYSSTVETYFNLFGRDNVLVLFYEELMKNPASFLGKISDFFGVSRFNSDSVSQKSKVGLTNRGAKIMQKTNYLAKIFPLASKSVSFFDRNLFKKLKDVNLVPAKEKQNLADLYTDDNKKLAELLVLDQSELYR